MSHIGILVLLCITELFGLLTPVAIAQESVATETGDSGIVGIRPRSFHCSWDGANL